MARAVDALRFVLAPSNCDSAMCKVFERHIVLRLLNAGAEMVGEGGKMVATILLVDADLSSRSSWEDLLSTQGYKVFTAESGRAALEDCARIQPDLVLVESSLPDLDGSHLCSELKSGFHTRTSALVLMLPPDASTAAYPQETDVDDYWGRPASRWEVLNRVQSLLRLKSYIDQQAESVLLSLAQGIEAKDPAIHEHCRRVVDYALRLGESLNLCDEDLGILRLAGMVHDVGKVAIPDSILFKPGPLTAEEMEIVRRHPVVGENICAPIHCFRDVLPVIRHHHEFLDGTGYPDRLSGDKIPFLARILQIADVYDALTIDRPYRKAISHTEALKTLWSEAVAGRLDSFLVNRFAEIFEKGDGMPFANKRRSMLADYYSLPSFEQ